MVLSFLNGDLHNRCTVKQNGKKTAGTEKGLGEKLSLERKLLKVGKKVAGVEGLEPPTCWFEARRSIQLSYTPAEVIPS